MFGIMHQSLCRNVNEYAVNDNRFNYCGTCKSMGSTMGQSSRLALNYDIVFLSALLNEYVPNLQYEAAYFEKSCWKLPKTSAVPLVFEYTAALNVYLAAVKIQDNIHDSKWWQKPQWYLAKAGLLKAFRKAKNTLRKLNFPLTKVELLLKKNWINERTPNLALAEYVAPTAQITKLSFEHGADLLNISTTDKDKLGEIGHALGEMAYCMDAVEDWQMDKLNRNFNPMIANTSISKKQVKDRTAKYANAMIEALSALTISSQLKSRYILLLSSLDSSEKNPKLQQQKKKERNSCLEFCCVDCCSNCCCEICSNSCCGD